MFYYGHWPLVRSPFPLLAVHCGFQDTCLETLSPLEKTSFGFLTNGKHCDHIMMHCIQFWCIFTNCIVTPCNATQSIDMVNVASHWCILVQLLHFDAFRYNCCIFVQLVNVGEVALYRCALLHQQPLYHNVVALHQNATRHIAIFNREIKSHWFWKNGGKILDLFPSIHLLVQSWAQLQIRFSSNMAF